MNTRDALLLGLGVLLLVGAGGCRSGFPGVPMTAMAGGAAEAPTAAPAGTPPAAELLRPVPAATPPSGVLPSSWGGGSGAVARATASMPPLTLPHERSRILPPVAPHGQALGASPSAAPSLARASSAVETAAAETEADIEAAFERLRAARTAMQTHAPATRQAATPALRGSSIQ